MIVNLEELEDRLSQPSPADCALMQRLEGDIMILGAGGKMGPSLARLARRAADNAARPRRIIAVSRFQSGSAARDLSARGVEVIACEMLDPARIQRLPECPNIIYMAGRKFGSTGRPDLTWAMNVLLPARVAERFPQSRMVAFSTGNVYALREPAHGGAREDDPPVPVGEYAQSCLGRERVLEYYAQAAGLRSLLFRLNYAVDLRYGVLVDIARQVFAGQPVDLAVPAFNVIWQRDANSYALRSLELCASPPAILNITGAETIAVRDAAEFFAARFGRQPRFQGSPGTLALLSDASRCHALLGPPQVDSAALMEMVAGWVQAGGPSLNKPTHFEVADGKF